MTIRTLEELEYVLDDELAWRRKELADLTAAVRSAKGLQQNMLLRAGVALLYAHWEGFIKASAEAYVEYVAARRLKVGELASCFAALSMRRHLRHVEQSARNAARVALVEAIRNDEARAWITLEGAVETESNLNSDVLANIVAALGLAYGPFELKAALIDEKLLASRNGIAHGRYLEVDLKTFETLYSEMTALIQEFRNQLSNAAALQSYRRQPVAV